MIVVGDKEAAEGTISVRHRADGDLGSMDLPAFIAQAEGRSGEQGNQVRLA